MTISFSFMTALPSYHSESNFIAFNDDQKAAARDALQTWADVANITFVETADSDAVTMRFGTVTTNGTSTAGFAFFPGSSDKPGDIFLSNDYGVHPTNEEPDPGEAGFGTLLHEIGHALGLKHPFEGDTQLPANEENEKFTVMSNTAHPQGNVFEAVDNGGGSFSLSAFSWNPDTPMPLDIEAIQFLYGENTTTRSGDTTYTFGADERLIRTIYDAGGNDTFDLSATVFDQVIDLTPGSYSSVDFDDGSDLPGFIQSSTFFQNNPPELGQNNLAIYETSIIENAIGGSGDDTMSGNTADNSLNGAAGNDVLSGAGGDDTLNGGDGTDTASGGGGNDTLIAGAGGGRLRGQAGNDVLVGGSGTDRLEGGDGIDVVDYSGANGGVTVDLGTFINQVIGAGQGTDLIKDVEILLGSAFADRLEGSGQTDTLSGGTGIDTLLGRSGDDVILGGDDLDLLRGHGGDDTLDGGAGNDNLKAGGQDDIMIGGAGSDRLLGQSGNDTLEGGTGNDRLEGGSGLDMADYSGASGGVEINLSVQVSQVVGADQGSDLIRDVEIVRGSGFGDTLDGSNGDDTLLGEGGADKLLGRGGNDLVDGGAGDDILRGHSGDDTLNGGVGADNIKSGDGDDILAGGAGNDVLTGEAGNDRLEGGQGLDFADYSGASGGVVVDLGDSGFQFIGADQGTDLLQDIEKLLGSAFGDTLDGTGAGDTLSGAGGNDKLLGRSGDDVLDGGTGDDILRGNAGDDQMAGGEGADNIRGDDGRDTLTGDGGNDVLVGEEGDDVLCGGDDDDSLLGGSGSDQLDGDGGDDTLDGGAGRDTLVGGEGADHVFGGEGDDVLFAGAGNDTFSGGAGFDIVSFVDAESKVTIFLSNSGPQFNTSQGTDHFVDDIEGLIGTDFGDTLGGTDADNTIDGGLGNDRILGSGGANLLFGNDGDDSITAAEFGDTLVGGAGDDQLVGFTGADTFVIAAGGASSNDQITDFGGTDTIWVQGPPEQVIAIGNAFPSSELHVSVSGAYARASDVEVFLFEDVFGGDDYVTIGNISLTDLIDGGVSIAAGGGNDIVTGVQSDKGLVLDGGAGDDRLVGGSGDDHLSGGTGADRLSGGTGNDTLSGGGGDDVFELFLGGVTIQTDIDGGSGSDTLQILSVAGSQFTLSQSAEGDLLMTDLAVSGVVDGVEMLDYVGLFDGDDLLVIHALSETALADGTVSFNGAGGDDTLLAESADIGLLVEGGAGDDTLSTGSGDDTLAGGSGNDVLSGGVGNDLFVFSASGNGSDTITDFNAANVDRIDLLAVSDITDFSDLTTNHMTDNGVDTTISFNGGNDTITVTGIAEAGFDASDFIF